MKISVQEKAVVYRNLATLVNSGVHILEALESLEVQVRNPQLQEALKRVTGRVSQGHPLHNAMAKEQELFSTLVVALVKVGEKTGKLHNILERIAELTQNRDKLLRQLQSALAYPALVLTLCLLLLLFAPVLVFSDLLDLLRQLDTELPLVTQIYLAFSSAILSPLTYLVSIPLLGTGLYTVRTLLQNEERRQTFLSRLSHTNAIGVFANPTSSKSSVFAAATVLGFLGGDKVTERLIIDYKQPNDDFIYQAMFVSRNNTKVKEVIVSERQKAMLNSNEKIF